ncbi:hypothetical protein VTO42DRAFT_7955 [Malbranchea cinnamomea]
MAENRHSSNNEDIQRRLEYLEKQLKEETERRKREKEARKRAEEETRPTTFEELLQVAHELLSRRLQVGARAESTRGTIAARREKVCPEELCHLSGFPEEMAKIFNDVCGFLKPVGETAPRLFHSVARLEGLSKDVVAQPLRSEDARVRFRLPDGVRFEKYYYARSLEKEEGAGDGQSGTRLRPDWYCFHRTDDNADCLLTTAELKPPHKLECNESSAESRIGATLAQEYNVMVEEGMEFSYISNGMAYVFLHVPENEFWKLYYYICEPKVDANLGGAGINIEKTSIARVLCFCLLCCRSTVRDQKWRNDAEKRLWTWGEHLDDMAKIPDTDLPQTPSGSDHQSSEFEYVPSSERVAEGHHITTRSLANRCRAPEESSPPPDAGSSDDSDNVPAAQGHKARIQPSVIITKPAGIIEAFHARVHPRTTRSGPPACELLLHAAMPSRVATSGSLIRIWTTTALPWAVADPTERRSKLRGATYGYTIVGKGTTSWLWEEVSREAEIYRILQEVQGSVVPVFLGAIDMAQIYFLHGAGKIRHMLLMEPASYVRGGA